MRDLVKRSRPLTQFAQSLRQALEHTSLISVPTEKTDRIVWFTFAGSDEAGNDRTRHLVAQLTGRSAILLILDERNMVVRAWRASQTPGQRSGDIYRHTGSTPTTQIKQTALMQLIRSGTFTTASEAADHY